jgi:hypothetical protein
MHALNEDRIAAIREHQTKTGEIQDDDVTLLIATARAALDVVAHCIELKSTWCRPGFIRTAFEGLIEGAENLRPDSEEEDSDDICGPIGDEPVSEPVPIWSIPSVSEARERTQENKVKEANRIHNAVGVAIRDALNLGKVATEIIIKEDPDVLAAFDEIRGADIRALGYECEVFGEDMDHLAIYWEPDQKDEP